MRRRWRTGVVINATQASEVANLSQSYLWSYIIESGMCSFSLLTFVILTKACTDGSYITPQNIRWGKWLKHFQYKSSCRCAELILHLGKLKISTWKKFDLALWAHRIASERKWYLYWPGFQGFDQLYTETFLQMHNILRMANIRVSTSSFIMLWTLHSAPFHWLTRRKGIYKYHPISTIFWIRSKGLF